VRPIHVAAHLIRECHCTPAA